MNMQIFGESHGKYVGAVIDSFPAGIKIDAGFIEQEMKRRKANLAAYSTGRQETDSAEIISGVYNGYTTGAPVCLLIKNENFKTSDYTLEIPRPSHADYPAFLRFKGFNDVGGGGHFSGRLTAPMVACGALCKLALKKYNIKFYSKLTKIGHITDSPMVENINNKNLQELINMEIPVLDAKKSAEILELLESVKAEGSSVGAKIETMAVNVPAGIGGYSRIEMDLSKKFFSIPAVKAVEFGLGEKFAETFGKDVNDEYYTDGKNIKLKTNNNGGILGGITTGAPIIAGITFKPTPSIFLKQNSVNIKTMKNAELQIKGRHDPCVAVRAIPVVEAMLSIEILELLLEAYGYVNF